MASKIVASVLPADFARLGDECRDLEAAGVDRIQWDVMDGVFVPNITVGPDVIAACRKACDVPFEAHLMTERPDHLLGRYAEAGCEMAIVHAEALGQAYRTYQAIAETGMRVGAALNPETPLAQVEHVLELLDLVLIMTVSPGFGGQSYIAAMGQKITAARELIARSGRDIELEVDGGIGPGTIAGAAAAGADVFAVGSALWKYPSLAEGVADLRARAASASA